MSGPREYAPAIWRPDAQPFEIMLCHQGVQEVGPNKGPWIWETLRFVGLEPDPAKNPRVPPGGYAWCCSSLVWCAHQAGVFLPKTARVVTLWELVQARRIAEPEEGCAFVHISPGGKTGHTGFVVGFRRNGLVETVSGNTNALGGREGKEVARVPHSRRYVEQGGGGYFHMRREGGAVA